jgi:hypothetical protein
MKATAWIPFLYKLYWFLRSFFFLVWASPREVTYSNHMMLGMVLQSLPITSSLIAGWGRFPYLSPTLHPLATTSDYPIYLGYENVAVRDFISVSDHHNYLLADQYTARFEKESNPYSGFPHQDYRTSIN